MNKKINLEHIRHSAAHLLAHAVTELFPGTQLTIGPTTDDGFFYDFLPPRNLKEEDLNEVDARMRILAGKNLSIQQKEISKAEARTLFKDNPFKLELIEGIEGDTVGLSIQGDFCDLCRGGHVASTGDIKHFKLLAISGSYWRADKKNAALQRISGVAFETAEAMAEWERKQEEAMLYDHRRLGKQLDLFSLHEEGPGFPFFHPKGKRIINVLTNYMRTLHEENDYQEISTPAMLNVQLWKQSGHWAHYHENMYFSEIDKTTYALKPMNCPGAFLVYKTRPRSYRELPMKLAEFGHVHRHELSGVLHGLMRVRAFTIDDAHIFCMFEQIENEVHALLKLLKLRDNKFGFTKVEYVLATRPDKAMGSVEVWDKAIKALENALKAGNYPYIVKEKDGAFYGPKIDVYIEDSWGRKWTCGTIQLDFMAPENFDLSYVASSGKLERPVVIHQAIYGSFERFFAMLLEHYKGNLPVWLAPVQARILPIAEASKDYAQTIYDWCKKNKMRVELDDSGDPLAGQIKRAQTDRIPWMIIVGKKEAEQNTVTVRYLDGRQEMGLKREDLLSRLENA
jgi:threonyl-tRNA synthetase